MKPYLAVIRMNLLLALRERSVLFFNYVFPLIFFFGFGQFLGGRTGGAAMTRVVSMVLVIGILGGGLFGAGMRAVIERETGILRRYKVMPMSPLPLLVGSLITGWLLYLPSVALITGLSHFIYKMPLPASPLALFVLVTLGCFAFRAIGLIIGSVANSMAESNVLIQILYMPMLFLSGATIPVSAMPLTAQIVSQFLPASYLNTGVQRVMLHSEGIGSNLEPIGALILSTVIATWISLKLFRWEKEEKLPKGSKIWVLATMMPFILLGGYQAWSRQHIDEAKQLDREIRRKQTRLIRGARIFVGDGTVIASGAVLLRDGRVDRVFADTIPDAGQLNAEPVEAAGKTVLPGFVDTQVDITRPDASVESAERALAQHLYSGVIAVGTSGGDPAVLAAAIRSVNSGSKLGAEAFSRTGPLLPSRVAAEAIAHARRGSVEPLSGTLVQQVVPAPLLTAWRLNVTSGSAAKLPQPAPVVSDAATLGTGAGMTPMVVHGPAAHREMQLRVAAGASPADVLRAATSAGAQLLGAGGRIGMVKAGHEASLLLVDGDPLTDIAATERIAAVFFKGERVDRQDLFDQK